MVITSNAAFTVKATLPIQWSTLAHGYHCSVVLCQKSAVIPLTVRATQLSCKVDTINIISVDFGYIELDSHLKDKGVREEIAAMRNITSSLLIEEAEYFHEFTRDDWFPLEAKNRLKYLIAAYSSKINYIFFLQSLPSPMCRAGSNSANPLACFPVPSRPGYH